jgi:hypothetical protein
VNLRGDAISKMNLKEVFFFVIASPPKAGVAISNPLSLLAWV